MKKHTKRLVLLLPFAPFMVVIGLIILVACFSDRLVDNLTANLEQFIRWVVLIVKDA